MKHSGKITIILIALLLAVAATWMTGVVSAANEVPLRHDTGETCYYIVERASDVYIWNGTAFVATPASWGICVVEYTEHAFVPGNYKADFPASVPAGIYHLHAYEEVVTDTPADSDTFIGSAYMYWTGTYLLEAASVLTVESTDATTYLEGRTLASDSYFDPANDTVDNVTTVGTVTNAVVTDAASRTASKADVDTLATAASLTTVEGKVDTIDTNVDAVLVDTGTTLPATLTTVEGKVDTIDTNVDTVLVDTGTTLPATLTTVEGKVDTLDTNVDTVVAKLPTGTISDFDESTDNVELASTGLDNIPATQVTGVADSFREQITQLWQRFFYKITSTEDEITTFRDGGVIENTTQSVGFDGTTKTVGEAE